jgi:hypothetical protein
MKKTIAGAAMPVETDNATVTLMGWNGPDIGGDYWITPTVGDITS